ncbi:MAG TPA: hypothetical protein VHK27_08360, partial [Gammaproteobacteria bacterium]|nr:hypothetical protein [Gammaproteobacteria bacterium]
MELSTNKVQYRYHIVTQTTPDVVPSPSRFRVKVKKHHLIALVLKELLEFKGNFRVALSRPCVYGVFSGPLGGLAPREDLCVGCLRCTVQYPEVVQIYPNPGRQYLGDSYMTPDDIDTVLYEARTGRVPVRGAGYRGPFGGKGWDSMWTDMSEIVRPTRDGIHGREFISTLVDLGAKPSYLRFDEQGQPMDPLPRVLSIQVPFLFDVPPKQVQSKLLLQILTEVARQIKTLVIVPLALVVRFARQGPQVVPLVAPAERPWLDQLAWSPQMIALDGWDRD